MKLLALDTASERCSAALYIDERLSERATTSPRTHAEHLLQMAEALLAEAGIALTALDAIAFGRGPGAFTGLRVAAAVTQGLAFGADLPVVPVSDLAALAAGAARLHGVSRVLAAMDARLGEIYWGAYEINTDECRALGAERLDRSSLLRLPAGAERWFGAGSAFAAYGDEVHRHLGAVIMGEDSELLPTAAEVAQLAARKFARGEVCSPEQALPVYLREQVATPKGL